MPATTSEINKQEVDLNSSLQSDHGIQDIKLRLKSMKKNPWDLWELERTHRTQLGSLGKFESYNMTHTTVKNGKLTGNSRSLQFIGY